MALKPAKIIITNYMPNRLIEKHRSLWTQKVFLAEVALGLVFLSLGLTATYYANFYTTIHASNSVTDIILDNIPVVNVNIIFTEGAVIFVSLLALLLIIEPRRIPFTLKAIALFILTRSIFMMLTHLAPPLHQSYIDTSSLLSKISSGDDLFFSAHTGLPFLMALCFWRDKWLRYIFLAMTLIGGGSVLLGHLHYSIDVFSALFISFGVCSAAKWMFIKDYQLFNNEIVLK
jgi:membrane-associated phospholipid phosphatase